jgi:hypothetical protein
MSVSKLSEYSREVWLLLFAVYILSCIVVEIIQRKKTGTLGIAGEPLVSILGAILALIITVPLTIFGWILTWFLLYPMMGIFRGLHWLWGKLFGRNEMALSKSARLALTGESAEQIAEQIRRIQAHRVERNILLPAEQPKPHRARADGYQQDGHQSADVA